MTISTQTLFLFFFPLAASLVLTLLINRVRRWRQQKRDEAQIREAEYEDALRSSQAGDRDHVAAPTGSTTGEQSAVPDAVGAVRAEAEPAAAAAVESAAVESVEPSSVSATGQPSGPGVIRADQFMA